MQAMFSIDEIVSWFNEKWNRLTKVFTDLWHQVEYLVDTAWADAWWYLVALYENNAYAATHFLYRAFYLLIASWQQVLKLFIDWWAGLPGTVESVVSRIEQLTVSLWHNIKNIVENLYNDIVSMIVWLIAVPAGFTQKVWQIINDILILNYNRVIAIVKTLYNDIKDGINWLFSTPAGYTKPVWRLIQDTVVNGFATLWDLLYAKYNKIATLIADFFAYDPNTQTTLLDRTRNVLTSYYATLYNMLFNTTETVLDAFSNQMYTYLSRKKMTFQRMCEKVLRYLWEGVYA